MSFYFYCIKGFRFDLGDFRSAEELRKPFGRKNSEISGCDCGLQRHDWDDRGHVLREPRGDCGRAYSRPRCEHAHVCVHEDVHVHGYGCVRVCASPRRGNVRAHAYDRVHVREDACVHGFRSFSNLLS